jgi:hypothetical protein
MHTADTELDASNSVNEHPRFAWNSLQQNTLRRLGQCWNLTNVSRGEEHVRSKAELVLVELADCMSTSGLIKHLLY